MIRRFVLRLTLVFGLLTLFTAAPPLLRTSAAAVGDEHWDSHFGAPGVYDGQIHALAQAGANLYVGGRFARLPGLPTATGIARWDGVRWHALGTGVQPATARVGALAAGDNRLYIAGDFTAVGGVNAQGVAVWNGTAWARLGSGVGPRRQYYGWETGTINALAIAPNGDLYVAGYFSHIDDVPANSIARWDGTRWHAVGGGIFDLDDYEGSEPTTASVYALTFAPDGTLYAGGRFSRAGNGAARNVARWNGTAWSALGAGVGGESFSFDAQVATLLFHNGTLYAGGNFDQAGNGAAQHIAAWNGSAWSSLGGGVFEDFPTGAVVRSLLADGAGILAAGDFTGAGGQEIRGVARWNGSAWSAVGAAGKTIASNYLEVNALARAPEGGFVAGGQIDTADAGMTVFGISRWTGARWASLGAGVAQYGDAPAEVRAIATTADGLVFIGGRVNYAGGIPVNDIAVWDGERWHAIGEITGDSAYVSALLVLGNDLYVGGSFSGVGSIAARNVARYHIPSGEWFALGAGVDGFVNALALGDGVLYVGGGFDSAGGDPARDVAVWDGETWSGLGGDFEIFEVFDSGDEAGTYVNALAYVHGELFIGGHFQTIHDRATPPNENGSYVAVHNLVSYVVADASWNLVGPQVHPGVTTDGFSGFSTDVNALAYVGGGLYVGGKFNRAGGVGVTNLARYDLPTNTWAAIGGLGGEEVAVYALDVYGPDLFVGGTFTRVETTPARFVARYDTTAKRWGALGSGLAWYNDRYTSVGSIAVNADGVYLGGKFDMAGAEPSLGFARWAGPLNPTAPYDPGRGDAPVDGPYKVFLPFMRR